MAPLALALALALGSPGSSPPADLRPQPLAGRTLALASAGALTGDALVVGGALLTLQLFAWGALSPSAENFRYAAYGMLAAATLVPPLTAVLLGRLGQGGREAAIWRALALATAGQLATLAVGWAAAPHLWVMLPVQVVTLSVGTSLGLHWGRRSPAPLPAVQRAPPADREPPVALFVPVCPDAG